MKSDAPGQGRVRQIVTGGRPQEGPMQGVGGVKGGSLGTMLVLLLDLLKALDYADAELEADFGAKFAGNVRPYIMALARASNNQASINFRNSIRQGDESMTPLQYVYEAADCRLFQTAEMLEDEEALWRRVYNAMWEDGGCVQGPTNHPSAMPGVDYQNMNVPENAHSDFGINPISNSLRGETGTESGAEGTNACTILLGLSLAIFIYLAI